MVQFVQNEFLVARLQAGQNPQERVEGGDPRVPRVAQFALQLQLLKYEAAKERDEEQGHGREKQRPLAEFRNEGRLRLRRELRAERARRPLGYTLRS